MFYSIRLASINDLDQLCDLENACFDKEKYYTFSRSNYRHLLTKANANTIVACNDKDEIIGCGILFFRNNTKSASFSSLSILPELQGQGIGRQLFDMAEHQALKNNKTVMLLEIRKDNDMLLNSYTKKGYKIYKTICNYYIDGCACYKMRKTILSKG